MHILVIPGVDARIGHRDVNHGEQFGQARNAERGGAVLRYDARDLIVEPRRHAEIVGAVIAPVNADPLLLGGAVPA